MVCSAWFFSSAALDFAGLGLLNSGLRATVGPDFLDRVAPNTQMILGLQSAQGSESLIYAPYHRLLELAQSERFGFRQIDPRSPLLDLMAVRWLASTVPIEDEGWRLEARAEARV
ncbi:MAG: hypothetical protein ACLFVU_08630, partial [Phycisphaerae bacterium]